MSKVMIHPATYENVRLAVDWIFEIFTLELQEKGLDEIQCIRHS